jgi:PAS domain S-box-containing protein
MSKVVAQNTSLTEGEIRYRQLRSAVADYHYQVLVENGQVIEKNHASQSEAFTGLSPEQLGSDPSLWLEAVLPQDRSLVEQQIQHVLSTHTTTSVEYRIRRQNGQVRWIQKSVVPYLNATGQLVAYDGLLSDITDRKHAEEMLRHSEHRYRMLFEDDLTGDYVATTEGQILLCNEAFVKIFGFTDREHAIGCDVASLYQDPDSWSSLISKLRRLKSMERYERVTRRNDGVALHVIENIIGTFDDQGQLLRVKGYIYDDTQSRLEALKLQQHNLELERAVSERTRVLHDQHHHLEAVLNSAFDAIITIDNRGTIQSVNLAAERIFGYTSAEMLGQNVKLLMPSPYRQAHDGYLQRYRSTRQKHILDQAREMVACRKDGTEFPVEVSITEVDHSEIFTGIVHDISERKQLQRHILEIGAEEQRRIGMELHDGIAQELTGLALHAGTLLELLESVPRSQPDGNAQGVCIDETHYRQVCEFTAKLLQGLNAANSSVQHLAHGIMPVQIEPQGLQLALEDLAASICNRRGLQCVFDCPEPVVVSDNSVATHLYRIAQEAVNNALRHSQADLITISLKSLDQHFALQISDNGVGLAATATRPRNVTPGMGMGTRTMQYRCGMLGGTFHLQELETGGTSVMCIVPRSERIGHE